MSTTVQLMTAEEFLAIPEDGRDRELIRGELREKPMVYRNAAHSETLSEITRALSVWSKTQPRGAFRVFSGDAGFLLRKNPETIVGIDVAVASAETMARQRPKPPVIEGIPILAVEVLSPSTTQREVNEKTELYLECGVPLVWLVDPETRTVRVHRPGEPPILFNEQHELSGDPLLPGFRVPVGDLFPPGA